LDVVGPPSILTSSGVCTERVYPLRRLRLFVKHVQDQRERERVLSLKIRKFFARVKSEPVLKYV
jgi:hypothetical protein